MHEVAEVVNVAVPVVSAGGAVALLGVMKVLGSNMTRRVKPVEGASPEEVANDPYPHGCCGK